MAIRNHINASVAQSEEYKPSMKQVLREAGIPTAASFTCHTDQEVDTALAAFGPPYVVKDDALAAGKGVLVTADLAAARQHARACGTVVIEESLDGPEISLFAVTDKGETYPLLVKSVDHNADYTQWTLHIRDGIRFQDGTPLDGAAVKFNIDANRASPLTAGA